MREFIAILCTMFHRFRLYRADSLTQLICQIDVHFPFPLGIFYGLIVLYLVEFVIDQGVPGFLSGSKTCLLWRECERLPRCPGVAIGLGVSSEENGECLL